jgi:predicted Rossmann fold nucleotide-binding protein DprA/Smf involved in DNA uptake
LTLGEKTLYNVISDEPVCSETLIEQTGLEPALVISMLLVMELKGLIRQMPGERYIRNF